MPSRFCCCLIATGCDAAALAGTDVTEDEVDHVIETGKAEDLFQTALQEQVWGLGQRDRQGWGRLLGIYLDV